VTVHSLAIVDEDSSFNFKVKECKIWEESEEGEVLETHVYDFERKVLIEDNNTGGSSPNATYIEEGVLEDAEEVPAPEESRSRPSPLFCDREEIREIMVDFFAMY